MQKNTCPEKKPLENKDNFCDQNYSCESNKERARLGQGDLVRGELSLHLSTGLIFSLQWFPFPSKWKCPPIPQSATALA